MATPIWKDFEVTLGTGDYADFTIRTSTSATDTIYTGRSYKKPGATYCKVIINDICADYMKQVFPNLAATDGLQANTDYIKTFYVYEGSTQKASVQFLYDYSYDYELSDEVITYSMALPIDGIIDIRMPLLRTMRTGTCIMVYGEVESAYNLSFNLSFDVENDVSSTISGLGTYKRNSSPTDAGHGIVFEETSGWTYYLFKDTCAKYALYYVNEYGGWDFFVFQGGYKRTDKYKKLEMKRANNNATSDAREITNYANELTFALDLKTHLLTDYQASKMHHLLGSTNVYLYDLEEQRAYSAVIKDNQCEYKTYKNEGYKMVQYTVSVEIAKEMTRR